MEKYAKLKHVMVKEATKPIEFNQTLESARYRFSDSIPRSAESMAILFHFGSRDKLVDQGLSTNVAEQLNGLNPDWLKLYESIGEVRADLTRHGINLTPEEQEIVETGSVRLRNGFMPDEQQEKLMSTINLNRSKIGMVRARIQTDRENLAEHEGVGDLAVTQMYESLQTTLGFSNIIAKELTIVEYLAHKATAQGVRLDAEHKFMDIERAALNIVSVVSAPAKLFVDKGVRVSGRWSEEWKTAQDSILMRDIQLYGADKANNSEFSHTRICNAYLKQAHQIVNRLGELARESFGDTVGIEATLENDTQAALAELLDPKIVEEKRYYAKLLGDTSFDERRNNRIAKLQEANRRGNTAKVRIAATYHNPEQQMELELMLSGSQVQLREAAELLGAVRNPLGITLTKAENENSEHMWDFLVEEIDQDEKIDFADVTGELENEKQPEAIEQRLALVEMYDFPTRDDVR